MRTTKIADREYLRNAKQKLETLLKKIKLLELLESEDDKEKTKQLKAKVVEQIEDVDRLLELTATIADKNPHINELIRMMESARGEKYNQDQLDIAQAFLQVNDELVENYNELRITSVSLTEKHLRDMLVFRLVRELEQFMVGIRPDYDPPASFRVYEQKMLKQAAALLVDKDVSELTSADEKKAKKDATKVVSFLANIGINNSQGRQDQKDHTQAPAANIRKPGMP